MAFDKDQFRSLIEDVLRDANLHSPAAVELLMLTAAVESKLGTYLEQVRGPAIGIFQMEPRTHNDIWDNYLRYKAPLVAALQKEVVYLPRYAPDPMVMRKNLAYAILMARIYYQRVPAPLPPADNPQALAEYWKKYYNTHLGKGTVAKALEAYNKLCV
jgi:hypothetical protein